MLSVGLYSFCLINQNDIGIGERRKRIIKERKKETQKEAKKFRMNEEMTVEQIEARKKSSLPYQKSVLLFI